MSVKGKVKKLNKKIENLQEELQTYQLSNSRLRDKSDRLKIELEDEVDKKYYLLEYNLKLKENLPGAYGRKFGSKGKIEEDICSTLQAAMGTEGGNVLEKIFLNLFD